MIDYALDRYVDEALSGATPAPQSAIAALQRHRNDLDHGHERGLYFDERQARIAIAWYSLFKHYKGEWAGRPIILEPWQQFIIGSLFGWRLEDGRRRFRTGYISTGRKNGKTLMAAGVALYLLLADNEPAAEVYLAATKKDQAKICLTDCKQLLRGAPVAVKAGTIPLTNNISVAETASKIEVLGRDSDTLDGLNLSGAVIDELHAWPHRDLYDVIDTATSARRQSLITAWTTAGTDRVSLCFQQHYYTDQINRGVIEDDSHFGINYSLDDPISYEDPQTWILANPNLNISKRADDIERKLRRVISMPAGLSSFLRRELNVWTSAEGRWLAPKYWPLANLAPIYEADLVGRPCYAGLDLSATEDLTALVYYFPALEKRQPAIVVCRFWIPENAMQEKIRIDRVPYDHWVREGYVIATPGNVIDYSYIIDQVEDDTGVFDIKEIGFDPWGATPVTIELGRKGYKMIEVRQGFFTMSAPMKELGRQVMTDPPAFNHGGHPVLAWNADNVTAATDKAGNISPDKAKSPQKIDGIVALIIAIGRAMRNAAGRRKMRYDDQDLVVI